jgi:hypothetical protein
MAQDRIMILKEYATEFDASIDQEHLESHGIESFISKDDAGGMRPHLQLTMGVRLLINENDLERATEILNAFHDYTDTEDE